MSMMNDWLYYTECNYIENVIICKIAYDQYRNIQYDRNNQNFVHESIN